MKKLLIITFLLLNLSKSIAQCISIELAIEWRKPTKEFYTIDNMKCIPYLLVTYRNNTNNPVYFVKKSKSNENPPLIYGGTTKYVKAISDLVKFENLQKSKYKVYIGLTSNFLNYSDSWEILKYPDDINIEHESLIINDVLSDFYNIINKSNKNNEPLPMIFYTNEITKKDIVTKLREKFVFLKAGEKYIDSFNLIGFQLLGGDYTFVLKNDSLANFIYTNSTWDTINEKWVFKKLNLPYKVGKYKLYSGTYCSNEVNIIFPLTSRIWSLDD